MNVKLHFGALAPSIEEQIKKQGFDYDPKKVEQFQKIIDAITRLGITGYLTPSQRNKAEQRLGKNIAAHLEVYEGIKTAK